MKKNQNHDQGAEKTRKVELTQELKLQVEQKLEDYDSVVGGEQAMPVISFTQ